MSYHITGPVATITLDHIDNRNALTPELVDAIGDSLAAAAADAAVRVIVLTNTGPAFCAGADLKAGGGLRPGRHDVPGVLAAMMDMPKPVVARVAGHCAGGGVGLAAAADISIAAGSARFAFSEVRVGVAPAVISVVCLPKLRRADAAELFLTGKRITAARAAEIGLINRCVPDDGLDDEVATLIDELLAGAPGAQGAAKSLLNGVPGMDRDAAWAWTSRLSADLFAGDEARKGMAAFGARRPPPWHTELEEAARRWPPPS